MGSNLWNVYLIFHLFLYIFHFDFEIKKFIISDYDVSGGLTGDNIEELITNNNIINKERNNNTKSKK